MSSLEHDALRESAGLYALGQLEDAERRQFEEHLRTCVECAAEVRALSAVAASLSYAVPQVDPPPALRGRVLGARGAAPVRFPMSHDDSSRTSADSSHRRVQPAVWLAMAAALVMIASLGVYAVNLQRRVDGLQQLLADAFTRLDRSERQLAAATEIAQSAQVRMAVLTAPDLRQVTLAGQAVAPRATGRAFWSPSTGLVFAATDLPALPPGRTYQLWLLRAAPSQPVSAGLVRPDATGRVAAAFDVPPDVAAPTGVAVSIEPEGGVPQPTGELYLVGLTQ